jgi:ATP adenylyltransferase
MEKKVFVNIKNAEGRKEYEAILQKIIDEGKDPFAPEYIAQYHPNPILKQYKYWFVTESAHPYPGSIQHFLVISVNYAERLEELPKEAAAELHLIIKETNKEYAIEGGGWWMRYGNSDFTGATVKRLHGHIIAADPDGPGVRIPLK